MTGAGRSLSTEAHAAGLFGDIPCSNAKVDRAFDKTLDASGQHLGLAVTLGERVLGSCYCALCDGLPVASVLYR